MKTIKIIDLLNKIANGEELPKYIKYKDYLYEYIHDDRDYVEPKKWTYLFYDVLVQEKGFDFYIKLNDEVEIIEEYQPFEEDNKIEKLETITEDDDLIREVNRNRYVINELIDKLKDDRK